MKDNQYAPPVAHVEDHPVTIGPPPRQVKMAVAILWTTLALALPLLYLQQQRPSATAFNAFTIGFALVLFLLTAWIFVCIHRGRNWARITYLVVLVLSAYFSTRIPEPFGPTIAEKATNLFSWLLTAVAMYLLFIPQPSRAWFSSARRG